MSSAVEPGFWRRVFSLFDDLLDQSTASRAKQLDALGGNTRLRRAVEELLRRDREGTSCLDTTMSATAGRRTRIAPEEPEAGQYLGSYLLQRKIGAGGMSTVFLATRVDGGDAEPVAIKVARGESHQRILRHALRRERQILKRLNHPHIARFLGDGSTPNGMPFIVLEYIEGIPITQHCDLERHSPRQRLHLFSKVCEAVDHAHQQRIVHRDLKPSNVLVTPSGVPKVLDFGLAKQLDRVEESGANATTSATSTLIRGRFMTPSYASPEQVAGEPASVASDVYSLGVLLFQLLTGLRPWDLEGGARHGRSGTADGHTRWLRPSAAATATLIPTRLRGNEQVTIRATARASTPRQLQRQLRGDLDDLVSRCLHSLPERRYTSVADLRSAVRRYLDPT